MHPVTHADLIARKYREVFGAKIEPVYDVWVHGGYGPRTAAALGYRHAEMEQLFLEAYLEQPIERLISEAVGCRIYRSQIVEIGNFAADNAMAMVDLWSRAANDLAGKSDIAVATLTAPLRRMFARIGLPIRILAPAPAHRLGQASADWGVYYASDPQICMGVITEGQAALARFAQRRQRRVMAA